MKELEQKVTDEVQEVRQTKEERQEKFIGQILPYSGHKVFSLNKVTGELKEAKFTKIAIDFSDAKAGQISGHKRIDVEENCVYCSALNKKNAIKRFEKMLK